MKNNNLALLKWSLYLLIILLIGLIIKISWPMLPFFNKEDLEFKKQGTLSILKVESGELLQTIDVELAISDFEQTRGLMWRQEMKEMEGMLFIFEEEAMQSFWMLNTFIPLDLIFINSKKEIVSIKAGQPHSLKNVGSEYPAQYVLEVNQGFCQRYGIQEGDSVEIVKSSGN